MPTVSRLILVQSSLVNRLVDLPPRRISPEVGTSNPATRLSNVLFPQPLGPINAQKSPFATSTETRSSPVMVSPPRS